MFADLLAHKPFHEPHIFQNGLVGSREVFYYGRKKDVQLWKEREMSKCKNGLKNPSYSLNLKSTQRHSLHCWSRWNYLLSRRAWERIGISMVRVISEFLSHSRELGTLWSGMVMQGEGEQTERCTEIAG